MLVSYVLLLAAKFGCRHILSETALGAGVSLTLPANPMAPNIPEVR